MRWFRATPSTRTRTRWCVDPAPFRARARVVVDAAFVSPFDLGRLPLTRSLSLPRRSRPWARRFVVYSTRSSSCGARGATARRADRVLRRERPFRHPGGGVRRVGRSGPHLLHTHQVDTLLPASRRWREARRSGSRAGVLARRTVPRGRVGGARPAPRAARRGERRDAGEDRSAFGSDARRVRPASSSSIQSGHAARGGVLAPHPGVTLHVMDETYHRRSVTRRPLLVPEENALTCAAWMPDGRVALGDARGARFFANPDDGSVISPGVGPYRGPSHGVGGVPHARGPARRSAPRVGVRRRLGRVSNTQRFRRRARTRGSPTRTSSFEDSPFVARATRVRPRRLKTAGGAWTLLPNSGDGEAGQDRGAESQRRRRGHRRRAFAPSLRRTRATKAEGAAGARPGRTRGKAPGRRTSRRRWGSRAPSPRGRRRREGRRWTSGAAARRAPDRRLRRLLSRVLGPAASECEASARRPDASDASAAASAASLGATRRHSPSRRRRRRKLAFEAPRTCGGGSRMSSRGATKPTNSRACRAVNS